MLLGLVHPTSGEGDACASVITAPDPKSDSAGTFSFSRLAERRRIFATPRRSVSPAARAGKKKIPELLELVALRRTPKKKLREFSKGMLQRVGLAQALLNEPELVISMNLHPLLRSGGTPTRARSSAISKARGTSVFPNSHLLSEVEITRSSRLCQKRGSCARRRIAQVDFGEISVRSRRKE